MLNSIAAGQEPHLSCVSLTDRYLPALRRLQLVEAGGKPDVAGFEEVKNEVLRRANLATLPIVSKGKFSRIVDLRRRLLWLDCIDLFKHGWQKSEEELHGEFDYIVESD